jgi:hypothetical protein
MKSRFDTILSGFRLIADCRAGLTTSALAVLLMVFLLTAGCAVEMVADPGRTLTAPEDEAAVRAALSHGDWLLARGVHPMDNVVVSVTNMALSHAAIYDAQYGQVVEVDGSGVHTRSLADFLAQSQRVMVMTPIWANDQTRGPAVERARSWLGHGYNYTGLVGINMPDRLYCTQLALDAYKPAIEADPPLNPLPPVLSPGQMYHWARIIYDSGPLLSSPAPE